MPHAAVPNPQQSPAGCFRLAAGRTLALRPRARSVLAMKQGRVWLTQGDEDIVVSPGERWVARPGGLVVIEPLGGPADFCWNACG
ncbi:MAG: DUF2917 domain-containing protein [Acidovorax sp.]